MSHSNALQELIYERLITYAPLVALIGDRVYDAPPKDAPYPFVSFGPGDVTPDEMDCIEAETHTLQLDIWSAAQDGQRETKAIRDLIVRALHKWQAEPEVGALVIARVVLSRVLPDPEKSLTHGVVTVECDVEAEIETDEPPVDPEPPAFLLIDGDPLTIDSQPLILG